MLNIHPRLTTLSFLALIASSSSLSVFLLLFYASPEKNPGVMLALMGASLFMAMTSFLTIILYFVKKLYYRGAISASLIYTSLRHAFFLVVFVFLLRLFDYYHVLEYKTAGLLAAVLFFIEATLSQLFFYE